MSEVQEGNNQIDELHIPHIEFLHWFSTGETKRSAYDKTMRKFGVRFFLRDIRADTPWTYVSVTEDVSLTISHDNEIISVWFEESENGFLKSILVESDSSGSIEAFNKCYNYISSILILPRKIGHLTKQLF
ncbi:hypothetical protein [Legionella pneumophila]|uniref:hypothetical protein n=1 Tax=Legionella pneumophila TaxID=446 RepID=UPI00078769D0|nr:hypothetical protein [Legionella pneumophila]